MPNLMKDKSDVKVYYNPYYKLDLEEILGSGIELRTGNLELEIYKKNKYLGHMLIRNHNIPWYEHLTKNYLQLTSLFLEKTGTGLGTKMIRVIFELAKRYGADGVVLDTRMVCKDRRDRKYILTPQKRLSYFKYLTNKLKEEGIIKEVHEFEHSAGLIDMVCVLNV